MLELLIISSLVLLVFVSLYFYWGSHCFRLYRSGSDQNVIPTYLPKATVILPLRGNDPFILKCLQGVLTQDYPDYKVIIVVDHETDPVLKVVKDFLSKQNHPHCKVSLLENRSGLCGLKNESLIQGLKSLDASVEVVAWLDADVIPHQSWLCGLVQPLQDPNVGVASGIRWYAPQTRNPGTLIRYIWNSAAVVQMLAMDIAWGGSVAISRAVFESSTLRELWSQALWEDTCLKEAMSRLGLKLVFVPEITMVNEESTSLKSCQQFVTRQLLNIRFYHQSWGFISMLGICSALSQLTLIILTALYLFQEAFSLAAISAAILITASVCVGLVLWRLDMLIRQQVYRRGAMLKQLPWSTIMALCPTLALYFLALLSAMYARKIHWRGVIYEVESPFKVQIVHYEPYQNNLMSETDLESIV
jgi:cellulose synthase/poly-beta-1,6-N-acetylglucosamine synthase-like glycosyltransferase